MENLLELRLVLAVFISFITVVILAPRLIPALLKLKIGNTEREELLSHQVKNGTPSMGGLIILAGFSLSTLVTGSRDSLPLVLFTLGYGIIGFIDDYLKAVKKKSDGLIAWQKMLLQLILTSLFAVYVFLYMGIDMTILIPFSNYFVQGGYYLSIGYFAVPLFYFAVLGTVNGVNFTDGLDGLVSSVTIIVSLFFLVCALTFNIYVAPSIAAMIGALLGFLVFNCHPAKVFMGDTGSLALGGFVVGVAYYLQMPLFILIVGAIYVVEVLSVIIQVTYFKKTGGKRVFKMAPIHHHFELSGWSEIKVVTIFTIITILLCLVALLGVDVF